MISAFAGVMLQVMTPVPVPAPPAPPPPPPPRREDRKVRARANLGSLISNDDYPAEALRNHEEGVVGFRLQVGADGRVTNCTITSSSGHASLDAATCRLLTARAVFSPARNRRGRPVPDSVAARIVWRIAESSQLIPMAPILSVSTISATPAGEVTCTFVLNGQPPRTVSCPTDLVSQAGAAARLMGQTLEQTVVTIITPGGEAEPTDRADHGPQLFESEAVVGVTADGSVLECRVVRNETRGPAVGRPTPPSPCAKFTPGARLFEPAAGAGGPRTVTIRIRGYARP